MHFQIIMDTSGDTRHPFDPDDASAVAEAEKRFGDLTRSRLYRRQADGERHLGVGSSV